MKDGSSAHPPVIPDKLYFKIGEVSRIAEVPTHVLRFWESEFPKIAPKRTPSGQRLYTRKDVERVLTIKDLLYRRRFRRIRRLNSSARFSSKPSRAT